MNNFIYTLLVFLAAFLVVGCQKKPVEQRSDSVNAIGKQKSDSVNSLENQIIKDTILSNTISDDYSGIYEGKISINTSSTVYELVEGWVAFDFEDNKSIVLYDGVFRDESKFAKDEIKGFGKFGKSNKQIGFYLEYVEDDFDENNIKKSFLRKTGNIEAAKEKIKLYKEEIHLFERFYLNFKQELINKDFKKLASYGNFPIDDESNQSKIISSEQLEKRLRNAFNENFFKEDYNIEGLNDLPGRFEDHYPGKYGGVYMMQTGVIFISFKKIGNSIKIISVSHPYG